MGTRSRIGVMHGDKVKSVYCHWDGYLEHNGQILQGGGGSCTGFLWLGGGDRGAMQASRCMQRPLSLVSCRSLAVG